MASSGCTGVARAPAAADIRAHGRWRPTSRDVLPVDPTSRRWSSTARRREGPVAVRRGARFPDAQHRRARRRCERQGRTRDAVADSLLAFARGAVGACRFPTQCSRRCSSPTSSARRGAPPSSATERWRATARARTTRAVRRELARHRGAEVDTAGDGFFCRLRRARARDRVRLRDRRRRPAASGSRSGPGSTPASASSPARSSPGSPSTSARGSTAAAAPGEVLVSSTVKDLVAGSGLRVRRTAASTSSRAFRAVAALRGGTVTAMTDAFIVDAVRTPIGRAKRRARGRPRRRARGPGAERARRPPRPRPRRDRGRADGLRHAGRRAGAQRRPRRRRSSPAGPRPCARRRSTGSAARRCRPPSTPPPRSRRAISTSSSRPASSRCRASRWARTSARERLRGVLATKLDERWQIVPQGISAEVIADGVGALARGRSTSTRSSPTGARSPRSTRAASSGRSSRSRSAQAARPCSFAVDETPRRDTSLEKLASLHAGLQGGRRGHRRQLERDRRRRRGDARRERGGGVAARARAARALRLVRPRRRRPVPHAPRQPAGLRAGAREGRPRRGTTSR